jgi:hypothetical protein
MGVIAAESWLANIFAWTVQSPSERMRNIKSRVVPTMMRGSGANPGLPLRKLGWSVEKVSWTEARLQLHLHAANLRDCKTCHRDCEDDSRVAHRKDRL